MSERDCGRIESSVGLSVCVCVCVCVGGGRLDSQLTASLDWNDTFLNIEHLKSSFPGYTVSVKSSSPAAEPRPPFR